HEDRGGCIRSIDRNLSRWGGGKIADGPTPGIDLTGLTEDKGRSWTAGRDGKVIGLGEYICLPDTVDPRGPKVKCAARAADGVELSAVFLEFRHPDRHHEYGFLIEH